MAKKNDITGGIKKIVISYANLLIEQGIKINKVIVFGSYARKKGHKHSDIDICVVSPDFGKDPVGEMQYLFKQTRKVDTRIEPIPASPEEYKNSSSPLIFEIRRYGKEVFLPV